LLFGYDLGVVAGALLFITPELGLNPFLEGLVVSSLLVGAMVGAAGCGPLSYRFGRRTVVLVSAVIFSVGAIGAALAPNAAVVILFRFVMGLALGTSSGMVPIYLSELAPAEARGKLSGLNRLMISTGILVAYLVNLALAPYEAWRWMFGLAIVHSLLLLIGVYFQPESPRWLIQKGRETEARAILRRSRNLERAGAEIEDIKRVNQQEEEQIGLRTLLSSPFCGAYCW
jgi:MFS family permease